MHWTIRHNTERNYVQAYQGGRYSLSDEASFLNAIFTSSFWRSGTPLVVNFSSMEMDNVDDGVVAIASRMVTLLNEQLGKGRFALVCDDNEKLKVGLQFKVLVAPNIDAEVNIFQDEDAAIDWATEPNKVKSIT